MADEVKLTVTAEPVEVEVEESEDVPEWASQLRSELATISSLLRESLEVSRTQTNLLPQVMETNANLTSQLQRVPGEIIELVRPLLTPPVLEVTPLTVIPPPDDENVLPVEVVEPEASPGIQSPPRKLRRI